ncbi:MAG: DUF6249 domain-containing protein [Parabacteroides sp.]
MTTASMIVILGEFVVLPVTIVSLITRAKTHAINKRAEIALAAIEKNSDVDLEQFLRKLNPPRRSVKERLLDRLLCGCIFTFLGIGIYIAIYIFQMNTDHFDKNMFIGLSFVAVPSLGIGLGFLINYFVGQHVLKQEIEAETKNQA